MLHPALRMLSMLPLIGVWLASAGAADPPARLALVMANSTYGKLPPLPQCLTAARNMKAALRDVGFDVAEASEVTNGAMNAAIAGFAEKAPPKAILVAYYCGYAAIFDGHAFLVPVSATLTSPDQIRTEGIVATSLVNVMGRTDPQQAVAIVDVAPAPGKSDAANEPAFLPPGPRPRP